MEGKGLSQFVDEVLQAQYIAALIHKKRIKVDDPLPSGRTVSHHISSEVQKVRSEVQETLKTQIEERGGCMTLDFWKEDCTNTPFLSITYHYVNEMELLFELVD